MRRFFLIVGLLVPLLGTASTAHAEKRVALVIGNDTYATLPDLNNARKDAEGMAAKLRELGFEVILKTNAGRRDLHRALAAFGGRLQAGATGLAFFAGHGIQSGGVNYLVPVDADLEVEADLRAEALPASEILAAMEQAGNPLNILILDACRDNPLPRRRRSAVRGLAVLNVPEGVKGTAILYSAGPGQTAEDGPPGGHGVFTGELLKAMDMPGLTIEQAFKETSRRVHARTHNRQRPWFLASIQGDFIFRPGEGAVSTPTPSAPGTNMEALFWQTIQTSSNPADFEEYLRKFPSGTFAGLARNRLALLTPAVPAGPSLEDVRQAQRLLLELGYVPGPADGRTGSRTRSAIEAFQRNHRLTVDGTVSKRLLASLEEALTELASRAASGADPLVGTWSFRHDDDDYLLMRIERRSGVLKGKITQFFKGRNWTRRKVISLYQKGRDVLIELEDTDGSGDRSRMTLRPSDDGNSLRGTIFGKNYNSHIPIAATRL